MEHLDRMKARLDALRPLSPEQVARLYPMWEKEDALYVYASNAIEGNTLTLAETTVVLEQGVTIGGKSVREHLEAVNGAHAYALMLAMAREGRPITANTLLALHEAVVQNEPHAGTWRTQAVFIRGSRHVPPNPIRVPELVAHMISAYERESQIEHPILVGARLHFRIAHIHPFVDGNGRTARLAHNLHLIRSGYVPILIEPGQEKTEYFAALSAADQLGDGDPTPFVEYAIAMEERALDRYLHALEIAYGADG